MTEKASWGAAIEMRSGKPKVKAAKLLIMPNAYCSISSLFMGGPKGPRAFSA